MRYSGAFGLVSVLTGMMMLLATSASADDIELKDPQGDDKGPGVYTYPGNTAFAKGSLDLRSVTLVEEGGSIVVTVELTAIKDAFNSKTWGWGGFGVQLVEVYIDQDHKAGSGHKEALPGMNVNFEKDSYWEKALVIAPQKSGDLKQRINAKAKQFAKDVIVPTSVRVRGRKMVAKFPKAEIGTPSKSWGYQVLTQSADGLGAGKKSLLARSVNEFGGEWKFGGGHDYECDPHVIDMFAGKAQGHDSEKAAQFKALQGFKCDDDNPEGGTWTSIPMVYPGG